MRIRRVTAHAFGWLHDQTLELADGLTVVHGPNESGKSTWHAALVAGLCGRWPTPKAKGEPGLERYRPWAHQGSGDAWAVSAEVCLADGRRVELRHDLDSRHGWATDLDLGRDVATEIRGTKGVPDASRWLGLDRTAFVATACVRQSHLTLATEEANGIRTYVEGAASVGSADETAAAALARIETYRREHIGTERSPTRPLRVAERLLAEAETGLRAARERQARMAELAAQAQDLQAAADRVAVRLARCEAAVARVEAQRLRDRAAQAQRIAQLVAVPAAAGGPPVAPAVAEPSNEAGGAAISTGGRHRSLLLLCGAAAFLAAGAALLLTGGWGDGMAVAGVALLVGGLVAGAFGFLHLGRSTAPPRSRSAVLPRAHPPDRLRPADTALEALLEGGSPAELVERAELTAQRAQQRERVAADATRRAEAAGLDPSTLDDPEPPTWTSLDRLRVDHQEAVRRALLADQAVAQAGREHTPVAEAEEGVAIARAELARLTGLDGVLDRTRQFLARAQELVHRDVAPTLAAAVSRDLATVTAGRYLTAIVDPASLDVQIRGPGAAPWRRVEELSVGTRELVYLLVRVALAERMVPVPRSCPLLLDDVTIHADADRTARILDALLLLAQRRQVVLFTHQEQVRLWARATLTEPRHALHELTTLAPA